MRPYSHRLNFPFASNRFPIDGRAANCTNAFQCHGPAPTYDKWRNRAAESVYSYRHRQVRKCTCQVMMNIHCTKSHRSHSLCPDAAQCICIRLRVPPQCPSNGHNHCIVHHQLLHVLHRLFHWPLSNYQMSLDHLCHRKREKNRKIIEKNKHQLSIIPLSTEIRLKNELRIPRKRLSLLYCCVLVRGRYVSAYHTHTHTHVSPIRS